MILGNPQMVVFPLSCLFAQGTDYSPWSLSVCQAHSAEGNFIAPSLVGVSLVAGRGGKTWVFWGVSKRKNLSQKKTKLQWFKKGCETTSLEPHDFRSYMDGNHGKQ